MFFGFVQKETKSRVCTPANVFTDQDPYKSSSISHESH